MSTPKQQRLLLTGAVSITVVGPGRIEALVEGDTAVYNVTWDELDRWRCGCVAAKYRATCSHIAAVKQVVQLTTTSEEAP